MTLAPAADAGSAWLRPSSSDWPIAAAMLQFAGSTPAGVRYGDASAADWRAALEALCYEGFRYVELSSRWVDLTLQRPARVEELRAVCAGLGIGVAGYLVGGRTVVDGTRETVDYTLASIEAAAAVGAGTVCLGLHPAIGRRPGGPEWFWNGPAPVADDDPAERERVVRLYRLFAERAASVGIQATVEMYPGTYVGTAAGAVEFVADVGHPALGLNPDLGNLVRVQGPVEDWDEVARLTLPVTNYWHVKNYARAELPGRQGIVTHPASLEQGVISYRAAVGYAIAAGFAGTIVTEHYGGDGLGVSAGNRDYLRRLLRAALREPFTTDSTEGTLR